MRPDPRLIGTDRPPPPRPRREPSTEPRVPHARAHQDPPRPADRGLPRQAAQQREDQQGSDPQPQTPPRPPRLPPPARPQQRPDHHLLDTGAIGEKCVPRRSADDCIHDRATEASAVRVARPAPMSAGLSLLVARPGVTEAVGVIVLVSVTPRIAPARCRSTPPSSSGGSRRPRILSVVSVHGLAPAGVSAGSVTAASAGRVAA